jgi:site-specific recombinase XerD
MFLGGLGREGSALQIMSFMKEKAAAGLKQKSLLNLYVVLQKMLNLAVALELLNANPIRRVPKPKVERKEKPSLTPDQVKAIVAEVPGNIRALLVLLY